MSLLVAALAAAAVLSGCTATGMGWIPSNDHVSKATFGFSFDATTSTFSGSYHDPTGQVLLPGPSGNPVDVAIKGTGKLHSCTPADVECAAAPPAKGGCLVGEPTYQSQNPKVPGTGSVFLLVCDLEGDGVTPDPDTGFIGDTIFIQVDTGPYAGYVNSGSPSGSITVKS